jgi:GcrA cell cycle regulator
VNWTPEREETLRTLKAEGLSRQQIAERMGITYHSAVAKIGRLGVTARRTDIWPDSKIELLKRLWAEGYSASQIANRIGAASRSAVIGKVHRLGLSARASVPRRSNGGPAPSRRRKRKPINLSYRRDPIDAAVAAAAKEELLAILSAPEVEVPVNERKGLLDLDPGDCRWPINDPLHKDFHFCNGKATPGLPYCKFHAARAYQPPDPRRNPSPAPRRAEGSAAVIRDFSRSLSEFDAMEPA